MDDLNTLIKRLRSQEERTPTGDEDSFTMQRVEQIAESIHSSIQVTVDYLYNNDDRKLSIHDLKVWLQSIQEGDMNSVFVLHEYYYNEVATRAVMNVRSAVPKQTKRVILTQEVLRFLRDCSRRSPGVQCMTMSSSTVPGCNFLDIVREWENRW